MHFQVGEEKASISATDLGVSIRLNMPCDSDADDEFLIGAGELSKFLSGIEDTVTFLPERDFDFIEVRGWNKYFTKQARLYTMKVEEYPDFPSVQGDVVEVGSEFLDSLAQCLPFAASPEIRPNYACVFCKGESMFATDTYRMIRATCPGLTGNIPLPAARALLRAARYYGAERLMAVVNEEGIEFRAPDFTIVSMSTGNEAPNFERFIPEPGSALAANTLTINATALREAVRCFPSKGALPDSRTVLRIEELSRDIYRARS